MPENGSLPVSTIFYDVIIVGAGLAGLRAAYDLRDRSVLILEKESHPGGRVLTERARDVTYELGALFGYAQKDVALPLDSSELIHEKSRLGLYLDGAVYYGETMIECLRSAPIGPEVERELRQFYEDLDCSVLSAEAYRLVHAFFHVIHPGNVEEYAPARRRDALRMFTTHHHRDGNGELVAWLAKQVPGRLLLGADVESVAECDGEINISYRLGTETHRARAACAVVTVPAPLALGLLGAMNKDARYFLQSFRYIGGAVVVLAYPKDLVGDFSYVVVVDERPSTVFKQIKGDHCVLTCYYIGTQVEALQGLEPDQVISKAVSDLARLGIGVPSAEHLRFGDVKRWPILAPILSEETALYRTPEALRPTKRVFLSGDYTDDSTRPYGMVPALRSGRRAAAQVCAFLDGPAPELPVFTVEPLTDAYVYRIDGDKPIFKGRMAEGTIAFYGLILQAERDAQLRDYLLAKRRDLLWEYQPGYGVTAEDSALVLEGLLEVGVPLDVLLPSLVRLVEVFFDGEVGAFHTITPGKKGRARYWPGPCIDATAHCGYLLHRAAPDRFCREVDACGRFLLDRQEKDGGFNGRWFPSCFVTTYYAARLLYRLGAGGAVQKVKRFVLRSQSVDGGFRGSVIDTSAALLTLRAIHPDEPAIDRANSWLLSRRGAGGWLPEAVLYYWFESDDGERLFFHGMDRGRITSAWATLAAAGEGPTVELRRQGPTPSMLGARDAEPRRYVRSLHHRGHDGPRRDGARLSRPTTSG